MKTKCAVGTVIDPHVGTFDLKLTVHNKGTRVPITMFHAQAKNL